MKKLICVGSFLLLSGAAVDGSVGLGSNMMDSKMKDCIMMKGGKVMVKSGMSMQLMKDTTLKHGVMVMMDGTVKKKDGTTYMLKEGEFGNGEWEGIDVRGQDVRE